MAESTASPPPAGAPQGTPYPATAVLAENRLHLSLVWLVPIVALIIGAVLVVRALYQTGPDITIEFRSADGIEPGNTVVRFKEVVVGRVTKVQLHQDRQRVLVSVRLDKSVANIAVADTRFWVVRPRIGTAGISGLSTLFSGAYIGVDAGSSTESTAEFVGLEAPPFVLRGEPGRSFVLNAADLGSLDVGSPVYYRRTRVGRVVGYALDPTRDVVAVRIFIEAPSEQLVTVESRFWNASGIDVSLGADGLNINAQALASVIAGGIAFASPYGAATADAAPEGHAFQLFSAQKAALMPPDGPPVRVRMVFNETLRGLAPGAPIDMLGIDIGVVRAVAPLTITNGRQLAVEVLAEVYPARLGNVRSQFVAPKDTNAPDDHLFLKQLVDNGVRAQIRTGSLLTGQLYVALEYMPKAPKATLEAKAEVPTIPTVPGTLSDLQPQLAEIVGRINKIKFDEIGSNVQDALKSTTAATQTLQQALTSANTAITQLSPEAQRTLADVQKTLATLQGTLATAQSAIGNLERSVAQSDAPLQRNANQTLIELQRAAQALRTLSDYLQRHPESLLRGKPADPDVEGKR